MWSRRDHSRSAVARLQTDSRCSRPFKRIFCLLRRPRWTRVGFGFIRLSSTFLCTRKFPRQQASFARHCFRTRGRGLSRELLGSRGLTEINGNPKYIGHVHCLTRIYLCSRFIAGVSVSRCRRILRSAIGRWRDSRSTAWSSPVWLWCFSVIYAASRTRSGSIEVSGIVSRLYMCVCMED